MTPASTQTERAATFKSRTPLKWRDRSMMIPEDSDWPLVPVPPPRGANTIPLRANLALAASLKRVTTSSRVFGNTTAWGMR